jgi:hypothetical protein
MALTRKVFPTAIVVLLALLLAALSIPSLIAAFIALPYDGDLDHILLGKPPEAPAIIAIAKANVRAAKFFESARYQTNAATALLALKPDDVKISGLDTEDLVRQSLATAPASAYNWNRIAYFRFLKGDHKNAEKAWQISVLTGRYEPALMNGRVAMAISMFPLSDPATIDMLQDQVLLAAQADSTGLAKIVVDAGGGPFVRAVLLRDPDLAAQFNIHYTRIMLMKGWKARAK